MHSNTKKVKTTIVLLLALSLILLILHVPFVVAAEDSWVSKTPMPTSRAWFGVAAVEGKIYAIGGNNWTSVLNTNEMYDTATNTWTTKTPMPIPRNRFAIAVYQNKIYVMGGETKQSDYTGANEVYDPLTDTWETKSSMPTPRKDLDANLVDGKIYLIGGTPNGTLNEAYDPVTDTWTTKMPLPTAVYSYASAVVDNKIYVIGGVGSNLTQIYTPETDTWSNGAHIPSSVNTYSAATATSGNLAPKRIYILGGNGIFPAGLNQIYDPEKDEWTTGQSMPTARHCLGVAVVDDILYAIGGATGWEGPFTGANEQYTPIGYIPEFPSWALLPLLLIASLTAIFYKQILVRKSANA